jgi:hypothetical protein
VLTFEGTNDASKQFFNVFSEDCDQKGTALSDFFRRQMTEALVSGGELYLVDFPRVAQPRRTGPRKTRWEPRVRTWWITVGKRHQLEPGRAREPCLGGPGTSSLQQTSVGGGYVKETRWVYYDKRSTRHTRVETGEGKAEIELIDQGRHSLWKQERVPRSS